MLQRVSVVAEDDRRNILALTVRLTAQERARLKEEAAAAKQAAEEAAAAAAAAAAEEAAAGGESALEQQDGEPEL